MLNYKYTQCLMGVNAASQLCLWLEAFSACVFVKRMSRVTAALLVTWGFACGFGACLAEIGHSI